MLNFLLTLLAVSASAQVPAPVDALAALLEAKPEAVRPDLTDRLYGFLWDAKGKSTSFIPAKFRKDPALPAKIKTAAAEWIKSHGKEAASVFYVLGAGDKQPSWAEGHPLLQTSLSGFRKDDLIKKMAPWTENSSGLPGQWSKKHAPEWTSAFLTDAASQARRFLDRRPIQDDQAFDREGKRLSGQRELPSGEIELMRFNKATELAHPPVPKIIKNVGDAVKITPPADSKDK